MVLGDNNHVIGGHKVPATTSPCVYLFSGFYVTRFLTLRFCAPKGGFICGRIRITCEVPHTSVHCARLEMDAPIDQDVAEFLEEYLKGGRTLGECLALERHRFDSRVSEQSFFDACSRCLVNPFVCDAAARLVAAPIAGCAFCGRDRPIIDRFRQNPLVPSLVVADPAGPLACCESCRDFVETVVFLSDIFAVEILAPEPIPEHRPVLALPETQVISTLATASFSDRTLNSLLGGEPTPLAVEAGAVLELSFVRRAAVSSIILRSETSPLVTFCKPTAASEMSPGQFIFTLCEDYTVETVSLKFERGATLTAVTVIGRFVPNEPCDYPPALISVDFAIPERECKWNEATRTAVYTFDTVQRLRHVFVSVVEPHVQNLILWFILRPDASKNRSESLSLPRTARGAKLYYSWSPYQFDEVRVFYTDRAAKVVPHRIGFGCF
jgi:hypothetical protein